MENKETKTEGASFLAKLKANPKTTGLIAVLALIVIITATAFSIYSYTVQSHKAACDKYKATMANSANENGAWNQTINTGEDLLAHLDKISKVEIPAAYILTRPKDGDSIGETKISKAELIYDRIVQLNYDWGKGVNNAWLSFYAKDLVKVEPSVTKDLMSHIKQFKLLIDKASKLDCDNASKSTMTSNLNALAKSNEAVKQAIKDLKKKVDEYSTKQIIESVGTKIETARNDLARSQKAAEEMITSAKNTQFENSYSSDLRDTLKALEETNKESHAISSDNTMRDFDQAIAVRDKIKAINTVNEKLKQQMHDLEEVTRSLKVANTKN